MTIVIATVLWILFAYLEGKIEGYYYHVYAQAKYEGVGNLHPLYFVKRIVVGLGMCYWIGPVYGLPMLLALGLMFPAIHDGAYFCKRNDLNPMLYQKRFKDFGESVAVIEPTYKQRMTMAVVGLAIIVVILFYNI